jgi:hemerythrin-like domain-containing protein
MSAPLLSALAPKVTRMIRSDHARMLGIFHRYTADAPAAMRQALADRMCTLLEIHLKLEEDVFYPALRELFPENETIQRCGPEHQALRRVIARLRRMRSTDVGFDGAVLEMMRGFLHHVAEEETVLLPAAERVLADHLGELGGRMTRRRLELARPRLGEMLSAAVRSTPKGSLVAIAAAFGVGLLVAELTRSDRAPD